MRGTAVRYLRHKKSLCTRFVSSPVLSLFPVFQTNPSFFFTWPRAGRCREKRGGATAPRMFFGTRGSTLYRYGIISKRTCGWLCALFLHRASPLPLSLSPTMWGRLHHQTIVRSGKIKCQIQLENGFRELCADM